MAKDRIFFLLSVALLGLLSAYLFRGQEGQEIPMKKGVEATQKQVDAQVVQILVAQQQLNTGQVLTAKGFKWEEMAADAADPSLIIRDPKTEKWLSEATATRNINKGERIKRLDIHWPQESPEGGTLAILPTGDGKNGVVFHQAEGAPFAQFLSPGMSVDVVFTSKPDLGFGFVSATLLRNIRVLAVIGKGSTLSTAGARNEETNLLLEMTDREAEIFNYAEQAGTLSLGTIKKGEERSDKDDSLGALLRTSKSPNNFYSLLATYIVRQLFPHVDVTITATKKGFIASGKITEPMTAVKIREVLEKLSENGEKDVVDLMEVVPQQVLLCVRVLEVIKEVKSRLGVNWQGLYQSGSEQVALAAIFPRPLGSMGSFGLPSGMASSGAAPNYYTDARGFQAGNWTLSAVLDLLKEKGCGRILAEPNLTTVSGKKGHFFVGGEFPILIPQGGNLVGTVTVEYKKFGVILDFTPTVDMNGLITIEIEPEVSSIDKQNSVKMQGFDIPSLITRRASTTVKLWPGQCYAIAGLLQHSKVAKVYSLCGLNRLPIIGPLFNSKEFVNQRTELMIVLTPYLIYTGKDEVHWDLNQCGCECDTEEY